MKTQAVSLAILLLGAAGVARADQDKGQKNDSPEWRHRRSSPIQAPEIDPASMVVALTLLSGGMAVLRGRCAMKPKR